MDDLQSRYDIPARDLARGRNLKIAAWTAPVLLTATPAFVFLVLMFIFGTTPPLAATFFFLGLILTAIGFFSGLALSAFFAYRHSNWTKDMRERIAAHGIRAEEVDWFRSELKPSEKRSLKNLEKADVMLADAYRETLASRLTASRIVRSSKRELLLARRRDSKLRYLNAERSDEFRAEIKRDEDKLKGINEEAKQMLAEAESRLQMIEAAAMRGTNLADSEVALRKLSARARDLPLALEEAKIANEIRAELESGEHGPGE